MKRIFTILATFFLMGTTFAQVNLWRNGYLNSFQKDQVDSLTISWLDPYDKAAHYPVGDVLGNLFDVAPSSIDMSVAYDAQKKLYGALGNYGYNRHNDFGYAAVCIALETQGQDFVGEVSGYNWFQFSDWSSNRNNAWKSTTGLLNRIIWNTTCNTIALCNYVIATHPNNQYEVSQARAMRAFAYMQLASNYQIPYDESNRTKSCVPLALDTIAPCMMDILPPATFGEVYDQIKADLDAACADLSGFTRTDKSQINQAVAYGLRARLNLLLQNWEQAASDAQMALAVSGATPLSMEEAQEPGFASADAHNVIWANIINENDDVAQTNIINWVSHLSTLFLEGYTGVGSLFGIASALYDEIASTDVRKGWWRSDDLVNVKFGTGDGTSGGAGAAAGDWIVMRAEEMHLIIAEGKAKDGQTEQATTLLNNFVTTYRDPQWSVSAHGLSLLDEIWWQRRVELWGEGFAWGDIVRLHKPIVRSTSTNWPTAWNTDIPADDARMPLVIPERDIQTEALVVWKKGNTSVYDNPYRALIYNDSISFGPAQEKDNVEIFINGSTPSRIAEGDSIHIELEFYRSHNTANSLVLPLIVEADEVFQGVPSEISFDAKEWAKYITITADQLPAGTYSLSITIPEQYAPYSTYSSFSYTVNVAEIEKGVLFDGFVNAFYATGQPGWYVDYLIQSGDDGSFDITVINPYTVLPEYKDGNCSSPIADENGLYGGFPYNCPGDVDSEGTYNMNIHVDAAGHATFDAFNMGMAWEYGMFSASHYYASTQPGFWNSDEHSIVFPAKSSACFMADYRGYLTSEDVIFYLDKESYIQSRGVYNDPALVWEDVETTLSKFGSTEVQLQKNVGSYNNLYRLKDVYAEKYGLAFYWNENSGAFSLPTDKQPSGKRKDGKMIFLSQSTQEASYIEEVTQEGRTVKVFHFFLHQETLSGDDLGEIEETYYFSTEEEVKEEKINASKEDFLGSYTLTGSSVFSGLNDAETAVTIVDEGGELVLHGISYCSGIILNYDEANYTVSLYPQVQDTVYGQYDISVYTYTSDDNVSATEPIVFYKGSNGGIYIEDTSLAIGYLTRSEVAGGWLDGYYDIRLIPTSSSSANAPACNLKAKPLKGSNPKALKPAIDTMLDDTPSIAKPVSHQKAQTRFSEAKESFSTCEVVR